MVKFYNFLLTNEKAYDNIRKLSARAERRAEDEEI